MTRFKPNPDSPPVLCEIIRIMPHHVYVEVLNETHPTTGKRLNWHNTDTYGCTQIVSPNQIIQP